MYIYSYEFNSYLDLKKDFNANYIFINVNDETQKIENNLYKISAKLLIYANL
jgi:hypothetical protein